MVHWTLDNKDRPVPELTPQQSEFARQMVLTGGNATEAAINAGYAEASASQRAWELRQKPHVQNAITAEQRKAFTELASIALAQAKAMLLNDKTPPGVRVDLFKTVFDRAGLAAVRDGAADDPSNKSLRDMTMEELLAIAATFKRSTAQVGRGDDAQVIDATVESTT